MPLREVASLIRGVSFDKSDWSAQPKPDHLPFLRAGNIGERLNTNKDLQWVRAIRVQAEQRLSVGDLVICTSSGSASVVGKAARLEETWNGTVGAFLGIIRPTGVDSRYLGHWFKSPEFLAWRNRRAQGANIQNLRLSEIGDLAIPTPDIAEQRRIAHRLDEAMAQVSAARVSLDRQIDDCRRLKFSLIEEVVCGRAVATDDPADQPGNGWLALSTVARLESGHTPSRKRPEWWGGNVPWIALPDIRALDGRTAEVTTETTNQLGLANSSARLLPEGTVVLSRTASVGFVTVMGKPMATSQDFVNWVPGPKLRPWYLAYALLGARDYLRGLSSGAVHKTIYMPTLKSLHIRLPSLREQDRMVEWIQRTHSIADQTRGSAEAQSSALTTLPASILSAAFRGEL